MSVFFVRHSCGGVVAAHSFDADDDASRRDAFAYLSDGRDASTIERTDDTVTLDCTCFIRPKAEPVR